MKKLLNIFFCVLLVTLSLSKGQAQETIVAKRVTVFDSIRIVNQFITAIQNDTALPSNSEKKLATEYAVKQFVLNHLRYGTGGSGSGGSGGNPYVVNFYAVDSATLRLKLSDSTQFDVGIDILTGPSNAITNIIKRGDSVFVTINNNQQFAYLDSNVTNIYERGDSIFITNNKIEQYIFKRTSLNNIGNGYKAAVQGTNKVKTFFPGYAQTIDSTSNANGLTFGVDTLASGIHTENYYNIRYKSIVNGFNANIGSWYRAAIPNTNNIKTFANAFGVSIDSTTNTNALTFKVDTSTTGIHTENYYNTKYLGGTASPAGSNTNIQFNDGGVFGGSDDLTWNKTTKLFSKKYYTDLGNSLFTIGSGYELDGTLNTNGGQVLWLRSGNGANPYSLAWGVAMGHPSYAYVQAVTNDVTVGGTGIFWVKPTTAVLPYTTYFGAATNSNSMMSYGSVATGTPFTGFKYQSSNGWNFAIQDINNNRIFTLSTIGSVLIDKTTASMLATDNASSKFTVNSTTQGSLTPRMTTTQRDNILRSIIVTLTNPGTGYTSTPTVTFSAGTITATGTAGLSGNTVSGIVLSNEGAYSTAPTVTITGGGGSGATATATLQPFPEGLEIYNLTTHTKNYYNGTSWVSY